MEFIFLEWKYIERVMKGEKNYEISAEKNFLPFCFAK